MLVKNHGARPHWAGESTLSTIQRAESFPKFSKFANICKKYDPDQIFVNQFMYDSLATRV